MSTPSQLIPSAFLFRFSVPCRPCKSDWGQKGIELDTVHSMPTFHAELDAGAQFADFRVGWSDNGLAVNVRVEGKRQAPWCRANRLEDSDGLSLWIDTRDTRTIHRAGRFCHRFILLPQGGGRRHDEPLANLVTIHRAKENPKPFPADRIQVYSEKRIDGYLLRGFIPREAMTGFDPREYSQLGFAYAVTDRELGWQTLSLGAEYPFTSDPSLWGSLQLLDS